LNPEAGEKLRADWSFFGENAWNWRTVFSPGRAKPTRRDVACYVFAWCIGAAGKTLQATSLRKR
jgi:hypothetical protein